MSVERRGETVLCECVEQQQQDSKSGKAGKLRYDTHPARELMSLPASQPASCMASSVLARPASHAV
ncbi:hypothetical protein PF005_g30913 [Phytophthora fragariae]|uniref:Uncharacterized protein n=1 Tax=Phytophthora fragariae TaxID=53985 RepID=A0A6A3PWH3_9STRA|nr:hypothetical protein PF003_g28629 [Phytophthora fragariae]KAE8960135.1 hypothetical protein PF011_g30194 [Phytophthora fragariae]KAE9059781.1 hypothetical protein PF010_g30486 [Phytophthora fragariae]KAE9060482.1 hypothetical protein PF007_g30595 [Phytophthora fragariae]KAE9064485.1 hypothetical protein PF006_g30681 [Phytophthora fragariae]